MMSSCSLRSIRNSWSSRKRNFNNPAEYPEFPRATTFVVIGAHWAPVYHCCFYLHYKETTPSHLPMEIGYARWDPIKKIPVSYGLRMNLNTVEKDEKRKVGLFKGMDEIEDALEDWFCTERGSEQYSNML
ncbi:hypothetical protein HUJ05_004570 [Dendroctonus ponderosae]|nr:hypothetical protein HUJ05_004570 [Dendroctonus ponderosae]